MSRSLRAWLLGSCALALASCSDDDPTYIIVTSDAGAVVPAGSDAGTAGDASTGNCSGQDAITQLLCQFGLQGATPDAGAQAGQGQVNINDLLNSLGGLAGIFGGTGTTGTGTGTGTGTATGTGLGGLFGDGTQPGGTDCANATDPFSQIFCGLGRDGGMRPLGPPDDAGMTPPPADAGTTEDAGAPAPQDAATDDASAGDASPSDAAPEDATAAPPA